MSSSAAVLPNEDLSMVKAENKNLKRITNISKKLSRGSEDKPKMSRLEKRRTIEELMEKKHYHSMFDDLY